ncbi:hypothetical protein C0Q70_05794 [Pomacea canaliculata]|uniref:Uncharacterized protein n=1 Tax=Pomacea canaliculata TaxID=400727 RepID=A0A2T7PM73_POMCA|nr:hypothetical protein C0Q70_05794 [Pomacea canaliculata]
MTVVCWETNVAPDANGGCQLKEVVAGSDVQCVYRHERGRKDTKGATEGLPAVYLLYFHLSPALANTFFPSSGWKMEIGSMYTCARKGVRMCIIVKVKLAGNFEDNSEIRISARSSGYSTH